MDSDHSGAIKALTRLLLHRAQPLRDFLTRRIVVSMEDCWERKNPTWREAQLPMIRDRCVRGEAYLAGSFYLFGRYSRIVANNKKNTWKHAIDDGRIYFGNNQDNNEYQRIF